MYWQNTRQFMETWEMLAIQAGTKGSQVASTMTKISAKEQLGQGDTALLPDTGHGHWHCRHWKLDTAETLS